MISKNDSGLKDVLDDNNVSFVPDGIAVVKACKWLYRISCEPKRLKRFWNNNVKFIFKVLKERCKND